MKWEYKVIAWENEILDVESSELEELLNEQGLVGWELVNIIPQVGTYTVHVTTICNQLIFKRIID